MMTTISTNCLKRISTNTLRLAKLVKKNTHTSSQDLPTSIKKEYTDFIKVYRSRSTEPIPLCDVSLNKIRIPPIFLLNATQLPKRERDDPLEYLSLSKISNLAIQSIVPPNL